MRLPLVAAVVLLGVAGCTERVETETVYCGSYLPLKGVVVSPSPVCSPAGVPSPSPSP